MIAIACILIAIALLPTLMVLSNRRLFQPPVVVVETTDANEDGQLSSLAAEQAELPSVSVLIPARDEAGAIEASVRAALDSRAVEVEVVVLDDDSQDATADIVTAMAAEDARVRLVAGRPLPAGWNGKQHACAQLASVAKYQRLVFLDADVRLAPSALARLIAQQQRSGVALLSAFPYQETGTFWERLLIPLMHYILLGFLPLGRMRQQADPSLAAGCGQLFLTQQAEYQQAGTHAAIKSSRHDGLKLPRVYRAAGMMTDVCDGTDLARCRMYTSGPAVMRGLLKNADEGIAKPTLIGPFSVLLLGANVAPPMLLVISLLDGRWWLILLAGIATLLAWLPRWLCALQFRQSLLGVLLHPFAVLVFVGLQWIAFVNALRGKKVAWRGRL
ncbi:glycosyltransferase family 2 protein [Planctomycetaceae bacterium SH139]